MQYNTFVLILLPSSLLSCATSNTDTCQCSPEVERFREYVTIDTSPGQNLLPAVDFWRRLATEQDVEMKVYECKPNYPLIVLKWPGSDSSLTSVVLLSHMDVAPANYKDGWEHPPFSAAINGDCEIVGRGTQDMKSVAIQYYEALSRIKGNKKKLLRDVYMIVTPDEVSGSLNGLALFVKTKEYKKMNVGVALDLGIPSPNSDIQIYNQDKTQCIMRVDCYGEPTHSALLPAAMTTASAQCSKFYGYYFQYREEQYNLSLRSTDYSEFTVINIIGVKGITPNRIVPAHVTYYYAIYLAHNTSIGDFNRTARAWASEAGNVEISVYYEATRSATTKLDNNNPYWVAIEEAFNELDITLVPSTTPTTTDAKFIVDTSVPVFGFSPLRYTTPAVNGVNERLSISTFFEGISVYEEVVPRLANLPKDKVAKDPGTYLIKPTKL